MSVQFSYAVAVALLATTASPGCAPEWVGGEVLVEELVEVAQKKQLPASWPRKFGLTLILLY